MLVYHGTTEKRARRICAEGFLPRKPSRRVWFAEQQGYAWGRAKTQARRARDFPAVLACEVNLGQLRTQYGRRRVLHKNAVIAIDGRVPITVLRSYPAAVDQPASPTALADWVNGLLRLKRGKGVSRKHEGILRLSKWVVNRLMANRNAKVRDTELLDRARQYLPSYFANVKIDPNTLHASRRLRVVELQCEPTDLPKVRRREAEALGCLESPKAKQRIRGLKILKDLADPDLFDWCTMLLEDEFRNVRLAAMHTMRACPTGDPEALIPWLDSEDKSIRAAAVAAIARHLGDDAAPWLELGLKDPSPCVRLAAAGGLAGLDPTTHRPLFELGLYDSNREVARRTRKLTAGKGFPSLKW